MRFLDRAFDTVFAGAMTRAQFRKAAICADISAAANEFFLGDERDRWDTRADFGALFAPTRLGWYEYALPTRLRTEVGLQQLLPPGLPPGELAGGYLLTQVRLAPAEARRVLATDPLPQLVAQAVGPALLGGSQAQRRQELLRWQARGAKLAALCFCQVFLGGPQQGLSDGVFGLYLDRDGRPLSELTVSVLPAPLMLALGAEAPTVLHPLFFALSALNRGQAFLQDAPGPAEPTALPFKELVPRLPRVPAASAN